MDTETKPPAYDPARALTLGALLGVGVITLFICAVIAWQVYQGIPVGVELMTALTFILGWLTSKASDIYSNRFGSSQQSANKDLTIQQQARTQAVTQDALLDSSLVVTKTGPPLASATLPHEGAAPPASAPGAAPTHVDSVIVEADTAVVTESRPDAK